VTSENTAWSAVGLETVMGLFALVPPLVNVVVMCLVEFFASDLDRTFRLVIEQYSIYS
jgi:hypothetical protein